MEMRKLAGGLLSLLALAGCGQEAGAQACMYTASGEIAGRPYTARECWDLSDWGAAKAQAFCQESLGGKFEAKVARAEICPPAATGVCAVASYKSPGAAVGELPDDYYAQLPPEIAAEVKANMAQIKAETQELDDYSGLPFKIYYYADQQGLIKKADQKTDCQDYKKGSWTSLN